MKFHLRFENMIKLHFRGGGYIDFGFNSNANERQITLLYHNKNQNIKFRREKVRRLQTTY